MGEIVRRGNVGVNLRSAKRRAANRHWLIEGLEQRVLLTAVTWVGPNTGGDWSNPNNWSTNALPQPADDVTLNGSITLTHSAGADTIHSLNSDATFNINGGSLAITNGFSVDNMQVTPGGTLRLSGSTVFNYFGTLNVAPGAMIMDGSATLHFQGNNNILNLLPTGLLDFQAGGTD